MALVPPPSLEIDQANKNNTAERNFTQNPNNERNKTRSESRTEKKGKKKETYSLQTMTPSILYV